MFGAPRSRSRGFATAVRLSPPLRSSSFGAPLARRTLTRLARPLATHPIAPLLEAATRALLEVETTPVDFCSSQRRADTSCERFVLARARDDARRRCRNVRSPKRPAASHAVPSWSSRSTRPPCGGMPRVGREARAKALRTNREHPPRSPLEHPCRRTNASRGLENLAQRAPARDLRPTPPREGRRLREDRGAIHRFGIRARREGSRPPAGPDHAPLHAAQSSRISRALLQRAAPLRPLRDASP